jgi:hypothetical protein
MLPNQKTYNIAKNQTQAIQEKEKTGKEFICNF